MMIAGNGGGHSVGVLPPCYFLFAGGVLMNLTAYVIKRLLNTDAGKNR